MKMYLKKIKRKCMVRGCRNTESFVISRSRDMSNTIYMCKECISAAKSGVENYKEKPKPPKKDMPLFPVAGVAVEEENTPHPSAEPTPSPQGEGKSASEINEVTNPVEETTEKEPAKPKVKAKATKKKDDAK